ncbi:hypothetical protein M0802_012087 [Mischocyttarus mexicanus]|nr:hypothetical protein M0802_012087 [Mischocyttarus mexicanus]
MDVPIVGKSELGGNYEAGIRHRPRRRLGFGSCCRHLERRKRRGGEGRAAGGSKLTEVDRFARRKRERKKKKKKWSEGRWTKRGREGGGRGGGEGGEGGGGGRERERGRGGGRGREKEEEGGGSGGGDNGADGAA